MKRKLANSFATTLLGIAICSTTFNANSFADDSTKTDRSRVDQMISDWPARPRLAAQEMRRKYGEPKEISSERLIWLNAGLYKRIMVTKVEIPHDFPTPHMDFLEHTVSFNVPTNKLSDVIAFDSSLTIHKTAGEMSARCDLERHNILTLNLARDIIEGKKTVKQAREAFVQNILADQSGKRSEYVDNLQFKPVSDKEAAFADEPNLPGSPVRVANSDVVEKSDRQIASVGGDSEILAKVIAIDDNEVHAASHAESKKISQDVLDYAKMIHYEHGKNQATVMKLGQTLKVTPSNTKEVDKLRVKGADQLSKIVPLEAKDFESAYLTAMVNGHTEALAMLDDQMIPTAQNPSLKMQLLETRSHVSEHLKKAKELQSLPEHLSR